MTRSMAQRLCIIFLTAVFFYSSVHAIALPELADPNRLQIAPQYPAVEKRAWDTNCTDTLVPTPTVAEHGNNGGETGSDGAVTITVTVFVPSTTSRTSSSTRSSTSDASTPSVSVSSTQSSSSSAPSSTRTPSAAAGRQAQQLNILYVAIQVTDPCAAGRRACIDNMLAECVASSDGQPPKWVTQACPVTPSNGGMTCAAVPFISSPSPSTTSSVPASTPTGLAGYQPIPLTDEIAVGCFAKAEIAQHFESSGVDGANGGMFPSGFGNGALGRFQFRSGTTIGLALIASLMLW